MAFVSATGLRTHSQARIGAVSNVRLCKVRPAKANGATIKMEESIAPLNGDEAHPMKEPYPVAIGKKAPVCRCWQSKKFPLCDGSHNAFNKETGSHVGPLVISATEAES